MAAAIVMAVVVVAWYQQTSTEFLLLLFLSIFFSHAAIYYFTVWQTKQTQLLLFFHFFPWKNALFFSYSLFLCMIPFLLSLHTLEVLKVISPIYIQTWMKQREGKGEKIDECFWAIWLLRESTAPQHRSIHFSILDLEKPLQYILLSKSLHTALIHIYFY